MAPPGPGRYLSRALAMALASEQVRKGPMHVPMAVLKLFEENQLSSAGTRSVIAAATACSDGMTTVLASELVDGFRVLDDEGAVPKATCAGINRFVDMPIECRPRVQYSARFESATAHLCRQEVDIQMASTNEEFLDVDINMQGPTVVFYHGTILRAVMDIVKCGGFIPGLNGHTKGKTHYKGCFGSTFLDVAYYRGDPTRHLEDDGVYSLASCPAVLELEATCMSLVRYHRRLSHTYVLPGRPNQLLPGLRIRAVWWNAELVHNYIQLTWEPTIRAEACREGIVESCCGGRRQLQDFQCCGKLVQSPWCEKAGKDFVVVGEKVGKYFMCPTCARQWR